MKSNNPPVWAPRAVPLLCALVAAAVFASAGAEPAADTVTVSEAQCSQTQLGAPIDPAAIGEPVSGVRIDAVQWIPASEHAGALCVVEGQLLPVDQGPTAFPIRFAVALPSVWNRRSIHQGGGGMNGFVPRFGPAPAGAAFPGAPPNDAARGFAVYGSDSGHGQDPHWALNDEAIRNFGYAQLKKTHDVAQLLIRRMYGSAPRYRYFVGTSQGGREALTVAQRYPNDYEGVAANVPVVSLLGLMASPAEIRRHERKLEDWVPKVKARAIAAEFMRQCDVLDGLADGVINDYLRCHALFDASSGKAKDPWAAKRCAGNHDPNPTDASEAACLTDGQIRTLEFIFSPRPYGVALANGARSFGMWLPSTEVATGGLGGGNALLTDTRYQGQEGAPADAKVFAALGTNGVTGFWLRDLEANPLTFEMTPALHQREQQLSQWLDSTNPDLSAFRRHGGKLIVAIGTNDTLASPGAQLQYYAALHRKMGSTLEGFARLYVLPQRGHGLTGNHYTVTGEGKTIAADPLPSRFDRLALLQQWVEDAHAPEATQVVTGQNGTSGLMCSYPQHPQYRSGDPNQAAAWECRD